MEEELQVEVVGAVEVAAAAMDCVMWGALLFIALVLVYDFALEVFEEFQVVGVGLPMPKVENFCGGVQVTFQRKNVANNSGQTEKSTIFDLQNVLEEETKQLSERQKNIFNRLIETGQKNVLETSASLATHFKVDARTIRRDLSVLQTKGFIRHDGPDRGGRWVVIKG
ncbi:MAG: DeoR family transcriptional regulator [Muribaculaceae bacterium]|nr:DeoR family transcriptional regulator [Muribaculaceae bacterium]